MSVKMKTKSLIKERIVYKMEQFRFAIKLHCYRVARARLRDVAELQHELNPEVKKEVYFKKLITDHPEVGGRYAHKNTT